MAGQGGGGRRGRAGQAQDGPVIRPRWSTYLSCQALSDVTRGFRFGWWQGQGPQGVLAPSLHGPPQGPVPRGDRGGPACVRVCLWGCRVARVSRGPSLCVSLSYSSHIWNLTSGRYCDPLYPLKQAFPPARCPTEFLEFQLRAGGLAGCLDSHPSQRGAWKEPLGPPRAMGRSRPH